MSPVELPKAHAGHTEGTGQERAEHSWGVLHLHGHHCLCGTHTDSCTGMNNQSFDFSERKDHAEHHVHGELSGWTRAQREWVGAGAVRFGAVFAHSSWPQRKK